MKVIDSETFRYFAGEKTVLSSPIHSLITRSALNCLPQNARNFYFPESEFLISAYCGLPDINWEWYGTFLDDTSRPADIRLPDSRREWNCTEYCERDAIKDHKRTQFRQHEPPDSVEAVEYFTKRALGEFRAGNYIDGVRRLGVALHYLQDCGSPSHAACIHNEYHTKMETLPDPSKILNLTYAPKSVTDFTKRASELVDFSLSRARKIYEACKNNTISLVSSDILDCAHESARATADVLYTVWTLVKDNISSQYPDIPLNTNLLENSSFRDDPNSDPDVPKGWVWCWYDLTDRYGKISWDTETNLNGNPSIRIENSPIAGIECRLPWSKLLHVQPSQVFLASCKVKTRHATGENYLAVYLYDRCLRKVNVFQSESVSGNSDWREIQVSLTVPDNTFLLRLAIRSDANRGTVWFTNVNLKRTG